MSSPTLPRLDAPVGPSAPATPIPAFAELGLSGLRRASGYVLEEYLPRLQGDRALKIFEEMETSSPVVGAALLALDLLMRQVPWHVATDDDTVEDPRAEFIESCLKDMSQSWHDTLSEILSMLAYGFSYHEIVYKRRVKGESQFTDGLIGWKKLPIRAQITRQRWEFDTNGGIKGMWQIAAPTYIATFLPIEKCLLFRPGAHKANPEGRSLLRRAYRPWYFAKRIEEFEGIGIERDLAGLPVVYVPAEIMQESAAPDLKATYEAFKKMVVNLRRDEQEGVVMPQQYDASGNKLYELTLLSTQSRRQFDTTAILQRYNVQILTTLLADVLALGHEKVGSFALASSKTNLMSVALNAILDSVAETFNRYAIPRLLEVNGMPTDDAPRLCHGDIETPDLPDLADYILKLSQAGMPLFPDRKVENQLREYANFPTLSDEEFTERQAALDEQQAAEQQAEIDAATAIAAAKQPAPGAPARPSNPPQKT